MMRSILLISIIFFSTGLVSAQSWEDSLRIGKQYYQDKEFEKAYRTLLEAQKLAPSDVDLSQDIGNAAYRSQDFDMAEKAFRAAASRNNDEIQNAKNWHNVGNSQLKAKNYQSAVESYKQSLRMNPNDEKTRYNLAEAQRRVKVQEEQEKQEKQENQKNQDQQNQDEDQQNKVEQENQNKSEDKGEGEQNKDQQQNPSQQGGNPNEKSNSEQESKLSDRKTERILEELLKQEMQTKKKVRGVESGKNQEQIKSGKRW